MKRVIFIILLLIVPFLVLAEDTCNQDDIKIESIVLDSSNLINAFGMFMDDNLYTLDYLSNWNMSKVKIMKSIFASNEELVNIDGIKNWDVSNVLNFNGVFILANHIEDVSALNNWNINKNASFGSMFYNNLLYPTFTKIDGTWNNGTFVPTS